jgi:hypothetical protein
MNQLDWDISDKANTEQVEEAKKKSYEMDVHFLTAFSTPSGKKVLQWLTEHTLDSPTWWPGQQTDYGFFREGQNSLIRQVKAKIKSAKDYQEKAK